MNTYTTSVESVQEPTLTEKAKDILQQVGEKIGLVESDPTIVPVSSPNNLTGPLAEIQEVRAEMGITNSEQKPLSDKAKETFNLMGERIEPFSERVKDSLYQAGETLGFVKPVQNIEGPLAEIQDVRQEMGLPRMEQPIQKPWSEIAKDTWNQAGERIQPYVEKSKESLQQAGESFYQAGETLGFIKPVQNIEGPLAEIQDVRQEMGLPRMEQPIQKPWSEIAKDTWNQAGERIEPYTEKAKETWNQAGERIQPYVEKSKESFYQAGETLGFVKPHQNIEGPLAEIQDVRQEMGWSKMEQPVQRPFTERAKETWNVAGETIEPYAEKAKETLYQAGETLGFVKPHQNIEGPLAEIQDVRQDMGWSKMEQPVQKPLTERAKETWNQAGERIEPYTEKAKETWNQAGERIRPYVEKSKESLQQAGETLGFVKPHQNIEGPLAEIQDVRQEMGWSKMEQPVQKPLTERAKETWNEAGERIEPYTEKAKQTFNQVGEQIQPYVEKSKESLQQAGETLGFVKPHQNIQGPLAEIQDVRQEMGWSKMEQPVQKPLTERAKETWNQAGERIEPYTEKAKQTWNQAGERIQPYVEKSKESLQQAGETLGFVKPHQNIEGPLAEIQDVRQDMGWSKMDQQFRRGWSEAAVYTRD
jgi:chaperonin cofactor prefoldin